MTGTRFDYSYDCLPGAAAPAVVQRFDYDALEPKGRRKSPPSRTKHVDAILTQSKRSKLASNARDIARNFAIASWMIRRHLDYVTLFDVDFETGDSGLNRDIEQLFKIHANPSVCDAGSRFSRERMFRLAELRALEDGDGGLMLLSDGRMQGIEGELFRDPDLRQVAGVGADRPWVNGVQVGRGGRHLRYSLHRRPPGKYGTEFDRIVPARNMLFHGFFDHYASSQVRGVSPIVAALNPLRDVYENFDLALAKAKVSQLFAVAFMRDAQESAGALTNPANDDDDGDGEGGDAGEAKGRYEVDYGRGPVHLDLDPGEDAKVIESQQPSTQFQDFTQLVIAVGLKALDIPYSFCDESHTNFFGSRAAWLHYERSCHDKRENQRELRRRYSIWKLQTWIQDGLITLPRGMTIGSIEFTWTPRGMPWWKPSEEIKGDKEACGAGFSNPYDVCKRTGSNFENNVDRTMKAIKYARDRGLAELNEPLNLSFATSGDLVIQGTSE